MERISIIHPHPQIHTVNTPALWVFNYGVVRVRIKQKNFYKATDKI